MEAGDVVDRHPALDIIGVIEAEQNGREQGGAQHDAAGAEVAGGAVRLAFQQHLARFVGRAQAEGQDEEGADHPEQHIDGEDGVPVHPARPLLQRMPLSSPVMASLLRSP